MSLETNNNHQEVKQEEVKSESNFDYTEPNEKSKNIDPQVLLYGLQQKLVNLPADKLELIDQFYAAITENQTANGNYKQYFKSNLASLVSVTGRDAIVNNNIFDKELNTDPNAFKNDVRFGDKKLNIKNLEMNQNDVNPKTAVARFTKYIDAGEVVQVPLWHSGFWVTIKPIKQKDFIQLEEEIAENQIKLGRETSSLIYSNYAVIVNRIVCAFLARHITEYSLKLESGNENIFDYISVQDLNPLILAMISTIYTKGLSYSKACKNNLVHEDGVKVCNNVLSAVLDPKKLLFVNTYVLGNNKGDFNLLDHMSKRRPNSVSLDSVKEYQRRINCLAPRTIKVLDDKVEITLEHPSISKYIDTGEKWVQNIVDEFESTLTEGQDTSIKNIKIGTIVLAIYAGIYNSFVKSIKYAGDNRAYTDQETIDAMLEKLSEKEDGVKPFINAINKYISESAVAIVAVPAYECEKCKQTVKEEEVPVNKSGFNNLVPLNMTHLFFGLSALARENLLSISRTY